MSAWTRDLIHLVAQFGSTMLASPAAIQFLIPSVCPHASTISKTFRDYPRALQLTGLSQDDWDDRICCIIVPEVQTLSVACQDTRFAVGCSDGLVRLHDATTMQEAFKIHHGEPVRHVVLAFAADYLVTAGRKQLDLWNFSTGTLIWSIKLRDQILSLQFSDDDSMLLAATRSNSIIYWETSGGKEVNLYHFSDIDEVSQSEYQFRRPPTHAAVSAGLKLLAVAYRQRAVILWDLEDFSYVGQFNKSTATYPGPLIFSIILNPNAEIQLGAAAYDDGDVVVFDPWTQREVATVDAQAAILAASPDGTVLAAGNGEGVITLYDFETLKILYRINSQEQGVKQIVFSSNSLRFLSLSGGHCNIWEPSVLVRGTDTGDDSSIDFSDEVALEPLVKSSKSYDEDRAITAITPPGGADTVICGREDGSVAAYSTRTGQLTSELYCHVKNIALSFIDWNEQNEVLVSVDRSGRLLVRKVTGSKAKPAGVSAPIIDRKCSAVVNQILLSPDGKRLLVSMSRSNEIWDTVAGSLVSSFEVSSPRSDFTWTKHPSDAEKIILLNDGMVQLYDWDSLEKRSDPNCLGIEFSRHSQLQGIFRSTNGANLCIGRSGSRSALVLPMLRTWPTQQFGQDSEQVKCTASYDNIAKDLKHIIGIYKMSLVYLRHDGWICSFDMGDASETDSFTRHFFIPFQFHSSTTPLLSRITPRGSIILAYMDEIPVFHNGLDFQEIIGVKGTMVPVKPSMRAASKRFTSNPV